MHEAEQSESQATKHASAEGSAAALVDITRDVLTPMESRISDQMLQQFKLLGNTITNIISIVVTLEQKVNNLPEIVDKEAIKDIRRTVNSIKANTVNVTGLSKPNPGQQSRAHEGFDISEALASEIIQGMDQIKARITEHEPIQTEEFRYSRNHIQDT